MEDFVILTQDQVRYLWHKLNQGSWDQTFSEYLEQESIDPDNYREEVTLGGYGIEVETWRIIQDILDKAVNMDPDEVVAGFLIKRKVR